MCTKANKLKQVTVGQEARISQKDFAEDFAQVHRPQLQGAQRTDKHIRPTCNSRAGVSAHAGHGEESWEHRPTPESGTEK